MPDTLPTDGGVIPAYRLPRYYAVTQAYTALRVAERFGVGGASPCEWWGRLHPAERVLLTAYNRIRTAEENER